MGMQVTVRELRQNLSVYLRRVERGETLSVTRRGEPVAVLGPLPGSGRVLDRLAAEGRLVPPAGDVLDLGAPPEAPPGETPLSAVVEKLRRERL